MDTSAKLEQEIEALDKRIAESPERSELYLQRGKCYQQKGMLAEALNDFIRVTQLTPDHNEAETYVSMLRAIFAFQYMDFYNP